MLRMLLLAAMLGMGATSMVRKLLFAAVMAFCASSVMRKLMIAALVAFGAAQADAGFSARPWYEGTFTCKISGSPDVLEVNISTQQGTLAGWGHLMKSPAKPSVDHVQPRGDTVSFYFDSNPRAFVELQRHRPHWVLDRGRDGEIITGKLAIKGKHYELTCTRR